MLIEQTRPGVAQDAYSTNTSRGSTECLWNKHVQEQHMQATVQQTHRLFQMETIFEEHPTF
jgi:hypothetical protein